MEDFYDLLGVSEDASTDEIDRAWRERVRTYHPDVNDDARATAQFKTLKAAHEVLSDERKRAAYDRKGHETYVRERLGGLPTAGQPGPNAADDGEDRAADERTTAGGRTTSGERGATGSERDRDGPSTGRSHSDRTAGSTAGRTAGASASTTRSDSTGDSQQSRSAAAAQSGNTGKDGRNARRSAPADERSETATDARAGRGAASATRGGRSRLQYAWIGVLLAAGVYLAGLWQYLDANAGALAALRAALVADPVGALTAGGPLDAPGSFALSAVSGAPGPALLFPIGAAVLAVAFVAVVVAVGRGSAYLYVLVGLAPLAGLAVGPAVALPIGAVLALVAVVPIGGTLLFALDVGRYVT